MTASVVAVGVTGLTVNNDAQAIVAASWFVRDQEVIVDFTPGGALAAGDIVTLTFPASVNLANASTFVDVATQKAPMRRNDPALHVIEITLDTATRADRTLRIVLDEVFVDGVVQGSIGAIAISVNASDGAPRFYGAAMPARGTETTVSATVPLAATIGVSTPVVSMGTLSPLRVTQGRQTYYVHSNNDAGVRVQIAADGPLRTATGEGIADVKDGMVTAGEEEYGITVEHVQNIGVNAQFVAADVPVPYDQTDISVSDAPVQSASFDIVYKASIDGETPAGAYYQTVYFTVSQNI